MEEKKTFREKYGYCIWALYAPIYCLMFAYTQSMEKDHYWISHAALDDAIPFVKEFILAYYAWFAFLFGFGLFFLIKSPKAFTKFMKMIAITFTIDIICFIVFPSAIDFRPETVPGNDIFSILTRIIYDADRCRNVFPSGHVVGALGTMFAVLECEEIKHRWIKIGSVILAILICLSTVFVKQHSVLDIYAGVFTATCAYIIVCFSDIKRRLRKFFSKKKEEPDSE